MGGLRRQIVEKHLLVVPGTGWRRRATWAIRKYGSRPSRRATTTIASSERLTHEDLGRYVRVVRPSSTSTTTITQRRALAARTLRKPIEALVTHNRAVVETAAVVQHRLGARAVRDLFDALVPAVTVSFVGASLHAPVSSRLSRRSGPSNLVRRSMSF
jgi:hypothetical protein